MVSLGSDCSAAEEVADRGSVEFCPGMEMESGLELSLWSRPEHAAETISSISSGERVLALGWLVVILVHRGGIASAGTATTWWTWCISLTPRTLKPRS